MRQCQLYLYNIAGGARDSDLMNIFPVNKSSLCHVQDVNYRPANFILIGLQGFSREKVNKQNSF